MDINDPRHPFYGIDVDTWNRLKDKTHTEIAACVTAMERMIAAKGNALDSMMKLTALWAKHRESRSLADLQAAEQSNPKAVMLIETTKAEMQRLADAEEAAIALGAMDESERSVVISEDGEPMFIVPKVA